MKSLSSFPSAAVKVFDPDLYGTDPREQIAAASSYQGDVGIEIELEGTGLPASPTNAVGRVSWIYHNDGSLRAVGGMGAGGAEYVLSEPISEADVPTAVGNLFTYLRNSNARIVNSTRCSTHVHLNMQGIKLNQLASFFVLWGTFEDALSLWCGGHRAGNHFALRLSDCDEAVARWIWAFQNGNFHFDHERRYLALNPACLQTFGSLEVRLMGGVENEADVVKWVGWLQKLKAVALSSRFGNPESIGASFSGMSASDFATEVLGPSAVREIAEACEASGYTFTDLIRQGFRRVQRVCYCLPWSNVIEECNKPFIPNPFIIKPKRKRQSLNAFSAAIDRSMRIRVTEDEEDIELD